MLEKENNASTKYSNQKLAVVSRIGDLRDGLLVLATGVYIAGYVSWTLYALERNLGLIPALDAQFFSAGLVPMALIVIVYYTARFLFYVRRWLEADLKNWQRWVGRILFVIAVAATFIAAGLDWFAPGLYASLGSPLIILGMISFYVAMCFVRGGRGEKVMQHATLFFAWAFLILGMSWVLGRYYEDWFPGMPQELGGPRPKCVELDLQSSRLSAETQEQLVGSADVAGVRRSHELDLIFSGAEFVLIEDRQSQESDKSVVRIRTSAIEAVVPC